MSKTQKGQFVTPHIPVPMINNNANGNGAVTAESLNRKQEAFNSFMKNKHIQNTYQQAILSQLQMQRANTQNSFDMNDRDLSNRSLGGLTPGGSQNLSNSFIINQYFGNTMKQTSNKPITPHSINTNTQALQQMILSAGGQVQRQGQNLDQPQMDPYTYLRWKQQKYKSCRSIQASGGTQFNKSNAHIIANSAYLLQYKKGNQTQKTNNNNKSICSSSGSALGSASMTTTMSGIKSLSEVKNPSMFIQWRFSDRKLTDLNGIGLFKNLTDLDISGNLLQREIQDLKQLQFLKKLNLSNNQISELYPLPHNLEVLNVSFNQLKKLNPEITLLLKNLTTFDISNNGLENLDGIQNMKRLKRLISKNNQINELQPLNDINSLIEIDLENNPIDSFNTVLATLKGKNDILILNLKMSPLILMINSYDQLLTEVNQGISQEVQPLVDHLKQKLKFFSNGSLYRSKRVYIKVKTMQQHSKRSSSNFSNGSSSCGRAGANTGGRNNTMGASTSGLNHNSGPHAFSPLLNNTVTTPNQQNVTQRVEDIEQLYDEILDEEEELERKQLRIQKRKMRKQGQHVDYDSGDDDEDESIFEDEDDNNPSMSCEEDLDDLQSFRNNNHPNNEFLNESTADFNKEIRMINQELREQLQGPDLTKDNFGAHPDHLQSLHSTQTVSTNKKNPISFKLDLSKCTQQQSEDDDYDNIKGLNDDNDDEHFEIPGLQFIKVTDDSFRQMQKQQSQQQSLRNKLEKVPNANQSENKQATSRDQPSKQQSKQVIIPKLQLGMLHSSSQTKQSLPIKQQNQDTLNPTPSQKSIASQKTFTEEVPVEVKQSSKEPQLCQNEKCIEVRRKLDTLNDKFNEELELMKQENNTLVKIITEVQGIVKHNNTILTLPLFIKDYFDSANHEKLKLDNQLKELLTKCSELENQLRQLNQKQQEDDQDRMLIQLREQLSMIDQDPVVNRQGPLSLLKLNSFDVKRTKSSNYDQIKLAKPCPQVFYNTDQHLKEEDLSNRQDIIQDQSQVEKISLRSRKRFICDLKRVKRPQSVVGHRKSSYCVKINSLLKLDQTMIDSSVIDDTQYVNEYGSTQEYPKSGDKCTTQLGQNSSHKVGHIIERLKERNSSLQERLNGSFGSGHHALKTKVSPLNLQKINLNLTQKQQMHCNPYIISPSNEDAGSKSHLPQSATNQMHSITSFTNQLMTNQLLKDKQFSYQQPSESVSSQNEYSGREYNTVNQHSKTQRLQVKKIQYNWLMNQQPKSTEESIKNLNVKSKESHRQQPSSDYQMNTIPRPPDTIAAADNLNFYPQQRKDNNQSDHQSFRDSNHNTSQSSILKNTFANNHYTQYQQ